MYSLLKVLQKKIKINSHIPLGKNGNIHGLKFSGFPQILVLCAISSGTGFEEISDHLLLTIQLIDMPQKIYMNSSKQIKIYFIK